MATVDWVVLELTPQGEDEDPEVLRKSLVKSIKGGEVFIPAVVTSLGDSRIVHKLIDNYVFVRRTFSDQFFFKLEGSRYISNVLTVSKTSAGVRKISCVKTFDIDKMRAQLVIKTEQAIEVGDLVEVMSGPYKGIKGKVFEEIKENDSVQVFISLRSKKAILTFPRSFLKFVSKEGLEQTPLSPYLNKISRTKDWARRVRDSILVEPPPLEDILSGYQEILKLLSWSNDLRSSLQILQTPKSLTNFLGFDGESLLSKYGRVREMSQLIQKAPTLPYGFALANYQSDPLQSKYSSFQALVGMLDKVSLLHSSLLTIERSIPEWKPGMVQNVIFDGHNLAHRVLHAFKYLPNPLSDKEGNPTTLIYGFLKSLSVLRKRFERANFYVVWDGSKQRRASVYPEYKANRPQHSGEMSTQMAKLREILTLLGVNQAYHPEEETDDLIACLVRGGLQGKSNLIVSTDRDFLQLVTYTDILMVPKVGVKQEILYDPDRVVSEYGVPPSKMVYLRALGGDSSDNLPGIPRVPKKVLASLLNAHNTLDGIYSSNLSGVTEAQYGKIKEFETQARLNYTLMLLHDELEVPITEGVPNLDQAITSLQELGVQADKIIPPFFTYVQGFLKQG
jgi:DNA polymerase-1